MRDEMYPPEKNERWNILFTLQKESFFDFLEFVKDIELPVWKLDWLPVIL